MRSRSVAQVLIAGLLATACGVEAQDAPEPLDISPSSPAPTPSVSEEPSPSPSPPPRAPTADPTASG